MKPKNLARNLFGNSAGLTAVIVASFALPAANAATLSWDGADATYNASLGGTGTWDTSLLNWGNGVADAAWTDTTGLFDIASFGGTAGTVTLGTNVKARGLIFGTAGYTVTGNTLTLGTSGIDTSALSSGTTTISSGLTLASGSQTWNVGTGSTLALSTGTFARNTGATLLIDKSTNTGTVSASNISNTNGIVGPWAIVKSTGTVANNTAAGYNFATKDGSNNLVAYTGATAVTTGFPASSATTNYDWSASGTQGQIGSSRLVNTIRYTGTGVTQQTNSTQTETINGLLNAGTGTVTLGGGSFTMNIQSGTGELVLAAMTSGITINGPIINNGATAGAVTILGANSQAVTLGGTNTFTGDLTINGTLNAGTGQGASPSASNLGALQAASNRNITVNNGGTLSLTAGNVLGQGGSTNTLSNTTLVVNAGGVFQTGLNGSGTGWWNKIGATNLNGGTIHVGSGANTGVYQGLALIGTVTVGGNNVSTIDNYAASNSTTNGVHLGQNSTANQSITFNVADVTNSSASDLDVSAKLLNTSSNLTASGFTKSGAGTMTLSATSAYTGATTISAGTLQIGNGTTDGSIATSSGITNNATLAYNLVGSQSYANAITGSGALTKAGAGTLTLSGANTYSGSTTLNAGGLALNGSLTSNITANSGATIGGTGTTTGSLAMNAGSAFSGNISGIFTANGVSFNGATNLVFSGATVNGTTYDLFNYGAGGVTGLNNLTSTFRAILNNDVANTKVTAMVTTGSRTWSASNGTWQSGGSGTNWAEGDQKYFDGDTAAFGNPASDSEISLSGTLLPVSVSVDNTNAYTFNGSGLIGGTSSLTKAGSGTLTLGTANTYSGATAVNAGVLSLTGSLTGSAISVASGATLNESGTGVIAGAASFTSSGNVTLNGANTYSGVTTLTTGTLNLGNAAALGGAGALVINGGSLDNTSGAGLTLTTSKAQTWSGDFSFTGTNDLNLGTGNVTLSGSARTVTVGAGALTVGKITGAAQGLTKAGAGTLTINTGISNNTAQTTLAGDLNVTGGTLNIGANDLTATGLTGSGTIANGSANTRWVLITNAADNVFSGSIQNGGGAGALGLSKSGAGTLTLSGTNSYTDATTLNAGKMVITGANTGAGTAVAINGGTMVMGNVSAFGASSLIRMSGSNVSTLDIATDGGDNLYALTFGTGTISTIVSDRATAGVGINHTLTTQSLANGVGGGTVNFTSGVNVTSGAGRITFDQLGLGAGSVQTTLLNPTTASVTLGNVSKQNNNISQTLGLGGTSTDNYVTGAISNGVPLTGANAVSLTKSGTSTWTLTDTSVSTYTGATTVSAGTLLVNGSLGNTAVTVNGGTLGGSGVIGVVAGTASLTVAANGVLAPGNSPGTLTINGSTTLGSGSTYAYQYTGGNSAANSADLVDVNGTLTINSGALLTLQDLGTFTMGDKFTLFAYDTLVGAFDAYADDQTYTINGGDWVFNYNDTTAGTNGGTGAGYITITAVPEPAAMLLGSLGVLTLLRRRRSA